MSREACLAFVVFLTSSTVALRCRECTYLEGKTEDSELQKWLDSHRPGSKDFCKDAADRAHTLDCSKSSLKPGDDAWGCVHRDNYLTAEVHGKPLTVHLVSRDCEPIKWSRQDEADRCYHSSEMRHRMQTWLRSKYPELRMKELHGHYCFCNSTDNCNSNSSPHYRLVVVDEAAAALSGAVFTYGTSKLLLLSALAGQLFRCYATFWQ